MMNNASFFRIFAFSLLFAAFSCFFTGFTFGVNNNVFHLPIIFNLFDLNQFKEDLFIQSLRYYSSGFWHLLRGAYCFGDIKVLFLCLFIFSRFIFFLGFFLCCSFFSSLAWKHIAFLGSLSLLIPFCYGMSFAGGGGLFLNSFTHSELANGLVLIFLYFLAQRQIGFALATNGLCFFVNCFMALWSFLPLGLFFAFDLFNRNNWKSSWKSLSFGIVFFAFCAFPIISNILSNPYLNSDLSFSYKNFLLFYWPYHSLAEAVPVFEYLKLSNVIIITCFCFARLGQFGRRFIVIFILYLVGYLFGILFSFFSPSFFLLNCNFLRSSVIFHLAAVLAITNYLFSLNNTSKDLGDYLAPLILLSTLLTDMTSFLFVPFMVFSEKAISMSFNKPLHRYFKRGLALVFSLFLFFYWSVFAGKSFIASFRFNSQINNLIEFSRWIRTNTEANSVFLLPTMNFNEAEKLRLKGLPIPDQGFCDFSVFQSFAERRVFVDFKRGASVMWCPDYYFEWKPRIDSVLRHESLNNMVEFAKSERIPYIIYDAGRFPDAPAFYKTGRFGLIKVF